MVIYEVEFIHVCDCNIEPFIINILCFAVVVVVVVVV